MPRLPNSMRQRLAADWREPLPREAQSRLMLTRAALVLGEGLGLLLALFTLHARLPMGSLALLLLLHLLLNGIAWARLRAGGAPLFELAIHLAADAALIAALVYLTGGYANPFISLLLVPLILAAVTLPALFAWGMAFWVGGLYTLLMGHYRPLALQVSAEAAVDMHLMGMWLNFLLTAALVATFAGRLAATLRRRDAQLAEAREARLRDEQLFALGVQAAAAAHDLATPLASLRLTLDDLRRDYAGDDELEAPLTLLTEQSARMGQVLARLGDAARARGATAGPKMATATWLARVVEHWGLLRPEARVRLEAAVDLPARLSHDAGLEAVLMTLLNNAADVSPEAIDVRAGLIGKPGAGQIVIAVLDSGPGLARELADHADKSGWGVGLDLARATLARLGGTLELADRPEGGAIARVLLPVEEGQ
ncbi:MAG: sensor histidine kinase [Gallionellaceae bacterium]|nr:sensor histidine kinase [Gallionellaceae bacterium]